MLFEGGNESFQVIASQDKFVRLQANDGRTFWTGIENTATSQPPNPNFDYTQRGKIISLTQANLPACSYDSAAMFIPCQLFPVASTALFIARVSAGSVTMVLIEISGIQYLVPPEAVGRFL